MEAQSTPSRIRFLILSDTHNLAFPASTDSPAVDVVLHCGDLTMIGGLFNYKGAIQNLDKYDAELKLKENLDVDDDDDPEEPEKAHALFAAAPAGIRLLDEGVHRFTLKDGRSFSIYASPYTPAFNGYAFAYGKDEDRFNPGPSSASPIPPNVDIVMTHGPPSVPHGDYHLDSNNRGVHCGCPKLWSAIQRARPRLHCFGHIHEGYGAQQVGWINTDEGFDLKTSEIRDGVLAVEGSDSTLLINAAIMNHDEDHNNAPWVVDMELP